MTTAFIGQPISRVDGRQKVTGVATYAAEFDVPGQAYAAIVRSTIANGRITSFDTAAAVSMDVMRPFATVLRTMAAAPGPARGTRRHTWRHR